jgi:hypothetical protein
VHEPPITQEERVERVPDELALAFAPLHKRAFGMAVGLVLGLLAFAGTVVAVLRGGEDGFLHLLSAYYYGYSVSWTGAFIAFGWTAFGGFFMGWFAAFCRNFVIALSIWIVRTRAELQQTRDFLDHI